MGDRLGSNKAIDIGESSICGGGRFERVYCIVFIEWAILWGKIKRSIQKSGNLYNSTNHGLMLYDGIIFIFIYMYVSYYLERNLRMGWIEGLGTRITVFT